MQELRHRQYLRLVKEWRDPSYRHLARRNTWHLAPWSAVDTSQHVAEEIAVRLSNRPAGFLYVYANVFTAQLELEFASQVKDSSLPTSHQALDSQRSPLQKVRAHRSRNTQMATERKAVIKNADMSEEMQQDAIDCASQALVRQLLILYYRVLSTEYTIPTALTCTL